MSFDKNRTKNMLRTCITKVKTFSVYKATQEKRFCSMQVRDTSFSTIVPNTYQGNECYWICEVPACYTHESMSTMKIRSMISQILTYLNAYFYERIVGSSNEII